MIEKNGTVIKGVGGRYTVFCDDGTFRVCLARGVFRHENASVAVGDRVKTVGDEKENGTEGFVIDEIYGRKNCLIRPSLANLTHLYVVIPCAKPKPDIVTVDKLISIAESKKIEPVVVVNKCDLNREECSFIKGIYEKSGFTCFALSAATGEGCGKLFDYLKSRCADGVTVSAFAGASAAGKSTLMTRLFPSLNLKTGDVSRKIQRGRHTTRHVELFSVFESGRCFIADTPGFSLLDFASYNFYGLSELPSTFREFGESLGRCKYTKCTHTKEEGCDILRRVENGEIPKSRHDSYIALYEEIKKVPEWKRRQKENS